MPIELAPERPPHGQERQRHDRRGQGHMGSQDREVEDPRPTSLREAYGPDLCMIEDIRYEEQRGHAQRPGHVCPVARDPTAADGRVPHHEQRGGRRVQRGIQRREVVEPDHRRATATASANAATANAIVTIHALSRPTGPVVAPAYRDPRNAARP